MSITFSAEGEARLERVLERYDEASSSVLPVLSLAQEEFGCLNDEVQALLAERLRLSEAKIRELVSFYSLLYEAPSGRHRFLVCKSLTCRMLGSDDVAAKIREKIGLRDGDTTANGRFTFEEVECIGACDRAPACIVDGVLHGPLDSGTIEEILEKCI
jgi:NADH-quinone oxidoreductase subunit E